MGKTREEVLEERCRQLVEIAEHWRRRTLHLERRLRKLHPAEADFESLTGTLESELSRVGQTTLEQAFFVGEESGPG
jgi:hypothetical protein